jgi:hypothetical protein
VRGLYEEIKSHGAIIAYDLVYRDEYLMNEFAVRDLDGHVLAFGQERATGAGEY